MRSTALHHLESLLRAKKLDVTLTSARLTVPADVVSSGLPVIDQAIGGGWRRGEISELLGARSSGRTAALLMTLATATAAGDVVALVDATDRFDPAAAIAAGLDLDRLLWVRGSASKASGVAVSHPMSLAIRAFDLIVRAGGFSVVALDVADLPPRAVLAAPFATWLRLAHANEGRSTVGLLIGEHAMGRSARGVSVHLSAETDWTGESAQSRRLTMLKMRPAAPSGK